MVFFLTALFHPASNGSVPHSAPYTFYMMSETRMGSACQQDTPVAAVSLVRSKVSESTAS